MKDLLTVTLFLKRIGFITRGIGIFICGGIIIMEALPDLKFNLQAGNVQTFTEQQIQQSNLKELPLYMKIADVEPIGEMYVEELSYSKKRNDTTLNAIIYPVYNLKEGYSSIEELKQQPCNVVVKDSKVTEATVKDYFNEKISIEGKFDQRLIDSETKSLLVENGYNISDNCIVLEKGVSSWSMLTCILVIVGFGASGLLIAFSLLPATVIHKVLKQEERFVKID